MYFIRGFSSRPYKVQPPYMRGLWKVLCTILLLVNLYHFILKSQERIMQREYSRSPNRFLSPEKDTKIECTELSISNLQGCHQNKFQNLWRNMFLSVDLVSFNWFVAEVLRPQECNLKQNLSPCEKSKGPCCAYMSKPSPTWQTTIGHKKIPSQLSKVATPFHFQVFGPNPTWLDSSFSIEQYHSLLIVIIIRYMLVFKYLKSPKAC